MMRLSLVRHAEAAATAAGSSDRHRVLTETGRLDAAALGKFLAREEQVPDQILCSDAVRTVDTAHRILNGAGESRPVVVLDALYHADPDAVLALIRENGAETTRHLMVVGHNPTIGALAAWLAQQSGQTRDIGQHQFAPATCAQFAVQALEWESFDPSHATFRRQIVASDYREA
ncbi:MAG: histidine phosphatase family protein [Alphaproteobacteria bacterium]|nr:histidine phosphatase family protein [Alphaproteobacteria bacterium]MCB9930520.1 histidine phosphatase family protein [Alphaproteobacteria bacterium]